jgi:putative dimethyl sulfoxide reductase chaperone
MPESDAEKDSAREDLCRFLAACYYEPDPAFAEEHLFHSMLAAANRIDPALAELAKKLGDEFAAQDLQTLLVDYTRLFMGPPRPLARPHGAFWLTGDATLMQDTTMAVLDLYQEGGFELDDEFREGPDHVAVELEFLYLLTFKRNEARRAGLPDVQGNWEKLEKVFLGAHLGAWVGKFTDAVKAGAETDFYRHLADLTERFVRMEEKQLNTVQ